MRFYQGQHRFYCGVDLHARSRDRRSFSCELSRFLPRGCPPAEPGDPVDGRDAGVLELGGAPTGLRFGRYSPPDGSYIAGTATSFMRR